MWLLYTLLPIVIIIGLYLFLIAPCTRRRKRAEAFIADYAHRGILRESDVENSLSALVGATKAGYGIELDVRLDGDGRVVVFHDDTLKRVCGIDRNMSEMTAAELSGVRLNGSEEGVPTLADVLAGVDRSMPLCVELKGTSPDTSLCPKVAELLDGYDGAYSIESFNPFLLAWFKKNRPDVIRGQLVSNFFREGGTSLVIKLLCTPMLTNVLSRPDYISYNAQFKLLSVTLCEKLFGAVMFAWTIRDRELYKRVRARGHAAIFQDFEPRIEK
jgi:glycerophosphoryl diester phosphodiesterase